MLKIIRYIPKLTLKKSQKYIKINPEIVQQILKQFLEDQYKNIKQ